MRRATPCQLRTLVLPISKMADPSALARTSIWLLSRRSSFGRLPSLRRPSGLTNSLAMP